MEDLSTNPDNDSLLLNEANVVIYDSECRMCSYIANVLEKSGHPCSLMKSGDLPAEGCSNDIPENMRSTDSLLYFDRSDKKWYSESDAVLRLLRDKGNIYRLMYYILRLLPRTFLNRIYRFIARNRYRWFGKIPPVS